MKSIFPYFMIDAIWSQYMMALGELGDVPDAFDNHPWKYQLYALFFMITLITQLVYLNMVIAFMADTFDKMLEIKPILALQQQMKIKISIQIYKIYKNEILIDLIRLY